MRILLLTLVLAGCASGMVPMSNELPPENWPRLEIKRYALTPAHAISACYDAVPLWAKLMLGFAPACAYVDYINMTCGINYPKGDAAMLAHEEEHCHGWRHIGSDFQASWERYLQKTFDAPGSIIVTPRSFGTIWSPAPEIAGKVLPAAPRVSRFYYKRDLDGKTVMVTRDQSGTLRYEVLP